MYRYFIELSYEGCGFLGWQLQARGVTVQATLNQALETLLRHQLSTTGAGRTDTGVHAREFYAHFDTGVFLDAKACRKLAYKLNHILPAGLAIHHIMQESSNAHARFDAISRTYEYLITRRKNPFLQNRAWLLERDLDLSQMQKAALHLTGEKDFSAFSRSGSQTSSGRCNVMQAEWKQHEDLLVFRITADRFLRNMVRAICGTLVEVGYHKRLPEDIPGIIKSKSRHRAGYSAPAHGLYLIRVTYPDTVFTKSETDAGPV